MTILVTGANGFVGTALTKQLAMRGRLHRAALRNSCSKISSPSRQVAVGAIDGSTAWGSALQNIEVVVHLASRVHMMGEDGAGTWEQFRRVNVEGTLNLAAQAAQAGIRRFIYMSSIKVNGESTQLGRAFSPDDVPAPLDAYAISKYEAEKGLKQIGCDTGMEIVIIRAPLVYGPGVKANFRTMIQWLAKGVPLPLGLIRNNRRSLIAVDNLTDFIIRCVEHPAAANQTFLVSDGEDLSTAELLTRMGTVLNSPARLLPIPQAILALGAKLLGKTAIYERLCSSLQVDITKAQDLLSWHPPLRLNDALQATVDSVSA